MYGRDIPRLFAVKSPHPARNHGRVGRAVAGRTPSPVRRDSTATPPVRRRGGGRAEGGGPTDPWRRVAVIAGCMGSAGHGRLECRVRCCPLLVGRPGWWGSCANVSARAARAHLFLGQILPKNHPPKWYSCIMKAPERLALERRAPYHDLSGPKRPQGGCWLLQVPDPRRVGGAHTTHTWPHPRTSAACNLRVVLLSLSVSRNLRPSQSRNSTQTVGRYGLQSRHGL